MDWQAVWLTLKLASITTFILLLLAIPLSWWLSQTQLWYKQVVLAIVTLPLVLPPTVLGFYLLLLLSSQGYLGQLAENLGWGSLAFSFSGLVIASIIYSLPFAVQPLYNSFNTIDQGQLDAAASLGASPADRFFSIVLPQSRAAILTAAVLSFAHTIGEFGVVLMIGGNISGETRVLSVAIYESVETLNYTQAHWMSAGLLLFSFVALLALYRLHSLQKN